MEVILKVVAVIGLAIGIGALLAFPLMWTWNWLMPVIFGLTKITIWQAIGLNIITSILFKSNSNSK